MSPVLLLFCLIAASAADFCLRETNDARAANGKGPLSYSGQLESAARFHNDYMRDKNCFSHACPGEPNMGQRVTNAGYRWGGVAENIFKGIQNCKDAVNGWMNSPGHRANILGDYKDLGCVGVAGAEWTCNYGRKL